MTRQNPNPSSIKQLVLAQHLISGEIDITLKGYLPHISRTLLLDNHPYAITYIEQAFNSMLIENIQDFITWRDEKFDLKDSFTVKAAMAKARVLNVLKFLPAYSLYQNCSFTLEGKGIIYLLLKLQNHVAPSMQKLALKRIDTLEEWTKTVNSKQQIINILEPSAVSAKAS